MYLCSHHSAHTLTHFVHTFEDIDLAVSQTFGHESVDGNEGGGTTDPVAKYINDGDVDDM